MELPENLIDVPLGRANRRPEAPGNFLIGQTPIKQAQYVELDS